jgi:uncharacterized protein (TIGR01777 family)
MAGEDVFTRWSQSKRERILTSRVEPTQAIARAIEKAKRPPAVWVNASAVGYYGSTGDKPVDETSPAGADRLAEVCKQWESAQTDCLCPETKLSTIRIGFVLGRGGGAFPLLRRLTKLLLGSALGSGKQWVPWIHVDDVARIFALAVDQRLEGPLNAVGPYPVTNAQLMTELRKQMRRPWAPNVPKPVLSLGALIKLPPTEVTLASQRALPGRLQTLGFDYKFPTLESALADLLA